MLKHIGLIALLALRTAPAVAADCDYAHAIWSNTPASDRVIFYFETTGWSRSQVRFERWTGKVQAWSLPGVITCSNGLVECWLDINLPNGQSVEEIPVESIESGNGAAEYMVFAQLGQKANWAQRLPGVKEPIELANTYRFLSCRSVGATSDSAGGIAALPAAPVGTVTSQELPEQQAEAKAGTVIDRIEGAVVSSNLADFARVIADHIDRIVGLNVSIDVVTNSKMVTHANGQFVTYMPGGDFEIVASAGFAYQHGTYVFDGYFIVKSGGMHQGVISYALEEIDEAQVLLTPGIRFQSIGLE